MPENADALQQKVQAALSQHLRSCSVCGQNSWTVSNQFSAIVPEAELGRSGTRHIDYMPVVPLICNTCGQVLLFHAKILGVYP
jgi:hypothetical protein